MVEYRKGTDEENTIYLVFRIMQLIYLKISNMKL